MFLTKMLQDQLNMCKVAQIPDSSNEDDVIVIRRIDSVGDQVLLEGRCYEIEVADYILNPPEGFTLASNWNNGTSPKQKRFNVDIRKIMGKMIKVSSPDWDGWLPRASITIIQELR